MPELNVDIGQRIFYQLGMTGKLPFAAGFHSPFSPLEVSLNVL